MDRKAEDFTTPLICRKCGVKGTVTWESGRLDPVATSSHFYLRVKFHLKGPRMGTEIVCAGCGTAHQGELGLSTVSHKAPVPKALR